MNDLLSLFAELPADFQMIDFRKISRIQATRLIIGKEPVGVVRAVLFLSGFDVIKRFFELEQVIRRESSPVLRGALQNPSYKDGKQVFKKEGKQSVNKRIKKTVINTA